MYFEESVNPLKPYKMASNFQKAKVAVTLWIVICSVMGIRSLYSKFYSYSSLFQTSIPDTLFNDVLGTPAEIIAAAPSFLTSEILEAQIKRTSLSNFASSIGDGPKDVDDNQNCRMETCFNFDRCKHGFKVYVYPLENFVPISTTYEKILNRIMSSVYYTNDPSKACLFVLSIDTLDRDELSRDFVRSVSSRLKKLEVFIMCGRFPITTENYSIYGMILNVSYVGMFNILFGLFSVLE